MQLNQAKQKAKETSVVYPGRRWAVVKAFYQVGGPYWAEEYSTMIPPSDIVEIYSGGEIEKPDPACKKCGHLESEHRSVAGGIGLACRHMGCDCIKEPAPAVCTCALDDAKYPCHQHGDTAQAQGQE